MNIVNNTKCIINFSILLLISVILTNNVFAQNKPIKFNRLTSSNGLSQNRVSSIVQDHDGFIWIGTEDGLNKYDGYNFEIFKRIPGDSLSINDNQALAMHVSKDGTLWIGGGLTGLSKYNSATKTFTRYNNDHSNPNSLAEDIIISFSEDTKGNLWIVTQDKGFDYMVVSDAKFIHMANMLPPDFKIPEDEITFIHQDKQNHLWVGAIGKVYYFKITYGETGVPQLKPEKIDNQILRTAALSIKEDNEGNIWIGTAGEGLLRFNYKDRVLRKIEPIADSFLINVLAILALETDDNGNIWIGGVPNRIAGSLTDRTFSGLLKLNIKTRELQKFQYDPKDEKSLSGNRVLSLLIDKTGVLWVGTNLSGVNVYDKSVIKFSLVNTGPDEFNIIKNPIRGFYLDRDNVLWIASQGSGLISYDRTRNKYEIFTNDKKRPNSISSDFTSCIYDDGKFLWIGTAGGLNRFDKNSKTFKRFYIEPSDPDSRLTAINYNIIEIDKYPGSEI